MLVRALMIIFQAILFGHFFTFILRLQRFKKIFVPNLLWFKSDFGRFVLTGAQIGEILKGKSFWLRVYLLFEFFNKMLQIL